MKNYQSYYFESGKLYEFRVKIARHEPLTAENHDAIKNALEAYQVETISKAKRLPVQEHAEFPKVGPCECYVIEVALKYPTIAEQVRQLIVERAMISGDCVCVYTKGQFEQLENNVALPPKGAILTDEKLDAADGQDCVGDKRNLSLIKELETRKYEIAGKDGADGKTTNDIPQNNKSPLGSTQNKIPNIAKKGYK